MSAIAAWISAGAAVVSIGAAIWATLKGAKAHRDSLRVQATLAEIEQSRERDRLADKTKARIKAEVTKEEIKPRVYKYCLRIQNTGAAAGRNVKLTSKKPHLFSEKLPPMIERIDPDGEHLIVLNNGLRGNLEPLRIEITWDDDSGSPRRFETQLSL